MIKEQVEKKCIIEKPKKLVLKINVKLNIFVNILKKFNLKMKNYF